MGFPKALLPYRNQTFLDRLAGLFGRYCAPVIVVLGAGAEEIRAAAPSNAAYVVNTEWRSGQTSSMQCGLQAVPADADGVLFTLVDHPAVEAETVEALLGRTRPSGSVLLRIPRYQGRRGHPIWLAPDLIPEFLAIREPRTAKDVVHAHAAETEFLDLADAGIAADIDDPAAYRALTGAAL